MFHGGFTEVEGLADDESIPDDDVDSLSDSDEEDEAADLLDGPAANDSLSDPLPASIEVSPPSSPPRQARLSTPPGSDASPSDDEMDDDDSLLDDATSISEVRSDVRSDRSFRGDRSVEAAGNADKGAGNISPPAVGLAGRKRAHDDGGTVGPRKTRVVVRDAAWSTWWAVLYWVRNIFAD